MKKIIVPIIAALFLIAGSAAAGPFLVCDPQPGPGQPGGVENYIVILDGTPYVSTPEDLGDGTVRLHYDLAGIAVGDHNVEVKAENKWGESAPVPFAFTKQLPPSPTNIGLEP
jgi:hypothetical protein